jgi:hypothetical protein
MLVSWPGDAASQTATAPTPGPVADARLASAVNDLGFRLYGNDHEPEVGPAPTVLLRLRWGVSPYG